MRLAYIVMTTILTLSVNQVLVTASVGSDVAISGVMSLGVLHHVDADRSDNDQPRYLRGNNIAEGDQEEERTFSFLEAVKQMLAQNLVAKMMRKNSFSDLDIIDNLAQLTRIEVDADKQAVKAFKLAHSGKMDPDDLAAVLKTFPDVEDDIIKKSVEMYSNYLKELAKKDA
ncbi:RxLR effector protein [Phytophthora megakarya]|uniref:RxLR effector protein n=1 Tax=Phytophthora megakarya TaxID=4795 RepID=A0A225VY34_9STRA|nr:RxLR effector protein [Phytophthora megakarya]